MKTVFQEFDPNKKALLNPEDTTRKIAGFPRLCVSTFSENIIQKFAALKETEEIAGVYTANGVYPVYKYEYKGTEIAFYLSRVGAPACTAGFEEVIAMGAEAFVLFGCGGMLDEEKTKGKIIVPQTAVRDEGTSYHYVPPSPEISLEEKGIRILEEVLDENSCPYVKGKTWTTDGIYRETKEQVRRRKAEGCLVVEMECAAMAAAAKFRGVPYAQFLYGADSLDNSKWEENDLLDYGREETEKYMTLAFECVLKLG